MMQISDQTSMFLVQVTIYFFKYRIILEGSIFARLRMSRGSYFRETSQMRSFAKKKLAKWRNHSVVN